MKRTLLFFLLLPLIVRGQSDSTIVFYADSTPKVKLFSDGHRESYYSDGTRMNWSVQNRDSCVRNQLPYQVDYHRSGNVSTKYFPLSNGLVALEGYFDSKNGKIEAGRMYHKPSTFKYDGNRLVEIRSERKKIIVETPYMPSGDPNAPRRSPMRYAYQEDLSPMLPGSMKNTVIGRCVAKGTFKHFELYNGFIYYYDEQGERALTEKVVNGVIQHNPKITFEQKELERIVINYYDRNFNGYAEKREVAAVDRFNLRLPDSTLSQFKWSEVFLFENLKGFVLNDWMYKMTDYTDESQLRAAVLNKSGAFVGTHPPVPNPPMPPKIKIPEVSNIVLFPDTVATFPGGEQALSQWIKANLKYPAQSRELEIQGTVYVEFLIMKDGSVSSVRIVKGIDAFIDREAKRLMRSSPNWNPAIHEGEKVVYKHTLPLKFTLY